MLPDHKKPDAALTFPEKLMNLMKEADKHDSKNFCIAWLPDGKTFMIRDPEEFTRKVILKFFNATKFSSFTRKLYRWGFRQVNRGIGPDDPIIFGNEYFQRDKEELMANMRSVTAAFTRKQEKSSLQVALAQRAQLEEVDRQNNRVHIEHLLQQKGLASNPLLGPNNLDFAAMAALQEQQQQQQQQPQAPAPGLGFGVYDILDQRMHRSELKTSNPSVEIESLFRLQLPNDLAQVEELKKLVDPLFFASPWPAPLLSNAMATNQCARKRELAAASQKIGEGPPLKKGKAADSVALDFEDGQQRRFRNYQKDQWTERFEELCAFVKKNGHSLVPNSFKENPPLASWTKRQRYQYKLKIEGKASTMTDDRVLALNALGFVWNAHEAVWQERFNELLQFKTEKGHCNVPSIYKENQKLATWVKCARRQYKLLASGKKSNMTLERATRLASVGFVWELRLSSWSNRE